MGHTTAPLLHSLFTDSASPSDIFYCSLSAARIVTRSQVSRYCAL